MAGGSKILTRKCLTAMLLSKLLMTADLGLSWRDNLSLDDRDATVNRLMVYDTTLFPASFEDSCFHQCPERSDK